MEKVLWVGAVVIALCGVALYIDKTGTKLGHPVQTNKLIKVVGGVDPVLKRGWSDQVLSEYDSFGAQAPKVCSQASYLSKCTDFKILMEESPAFNSDALRRWRDSYYDIHCTASEGNPSWCRPYTKYLMRYNEYDPAAHKAWVNVNFAHVCFGQNGSSRADRNGCQEAGKNGRYLRTYSWRVDPNNVVQINH